VRLAHLLAVESDWPRNGSRTERSNNRRRICERVKG